MKKILIVASVASMVDQFLIPYIEDYIRKDWKVVVATNFEIPGTITTERSRKLVESLKALDVTVEQIDFARSPVSRANFKAYKQLINVMDNEQFDIIHSHSPIGGLLTRLAAKNNKNQKATKVVYTAHGFHFYHGAPIQNWLIYYPIEKYMARYTDALITMNEQDYQLAKAKFKTRELDGVYQVNGVGIDLSEYAPLTEEQDYSFKTSLGIPKENFVITIIGELNQNKNQIQMIESIEQLNDPTITLVLVGTGINYAEFKEKYHNNSNVKILGYRTDVKRLLNITDIVGSMSYREGLPKNVMEAMATGKPVIATAIRGNTDLIEDGVNGFLVPPNDIKKTVQSVVALQASVDLRRKMKNNNLEKIQQYEVTNVSNKVNEIYQLLLKKLEQ